MDSSNAMKQALATITNAAANGPAAPAVKTGGGKRSRRIRKRTGKARKHSTRTYSAGGRSRKNKRRTHRRRRHSGGGKVTALSPLKL
jgi:hypothetical protein